MKKEFLTPSMNITSFDVENIVTASGAETNVDAVTSALKAELDGKTTVGDITTIALTW